MASRSGYADVVLIRHKKAACLSLLITAPEMTHVQGVSLVSIPFQNSKINRKNCQIKYFLTSNDAPAAKVFFCDFLNFFENWNFCKLRKNCVFDKSTKENIGVVCSNE
jgi:hypothetical protein